MTGWRKGGSSPSFAQLLVLMIGFIISQTKGDNNE